MCSRALIALGGFDSLHGLKMELQRFRRNPEDFMEAAVVAAGPTAGRAMRRVMLARYKESLRQALSSKGVDLDDMLPALERLDTLAEVQALCAGGEVVEIQKQVDRLLQKAMGETESAMKGVTSLTGVTGVAAKRLLVGCAKSSLREALLTAKDLEEFGLPGLKGEDSKASRRGAGGTSHTSFEELWPDLLDALECVDTVQMLRPLVTSPVQSMLQKENALRLLRQLMDDKAPAGDAARRLMLAGHKTRILQAWDSVREARQKRVGRGQASSSAMLLADDQGVETASRSSSRAGGAGAKKGKRERALVAPEASSASAAHPVQLQRQKTSPALAKLRRAGQAAIIAQSLARKDVSSRELHLSRVRWEELREALEQIRVERVGELRALIKQPKALLEAVLAIASPRTERAKDAVETLAKQLKVKGSGVKAASLRAQLVSAAKQLMIASLRPLFEAASGPIGRMDRRVAWSDVLPALQVADIEDLREAVGNVGRACRFVDKMAQNATSPVAIRLAIAKAAPSLRTAAAELKLPWDDAVRPALEALDSASILEEAAHVQPLNFLVGLLKGSSPVSKQLLLAQAKPLLVPALTQLHLRDPAINFDAAKWKAALNVVRSTVPVALEWAEAENALVRMEALELREGLNSVFSASSWSVGGDLVPGKTLDDASVGAVMRDASGLGLSRGQDAATDTAKAFLNRLLAVDSSSAGSATRHLLLAHARHLLMAQMHALNPDEPSEWLSRSQLDAILAHDYDVDALRDIVLNVTLKPSRHVARVRKAATTLVGAASWDEAMRLFARQAAGVLLYGRGMAWADVESFLQLLKKLRLVEADALVEATDKAKAAAASAQEFMDEVVLGFVEERVLAALSHLEKTAEGTKDTPRESTEDQATLLQSALRVVRLLIFQRTRRSNADDDWAWAVGPAFEATVRDASTAIQILHSVQGASATSSVGAKEAIAVSAFSRSGSEQFRGLPMRLASLLGPSAGLLCLRVLIVGFKSELRKTPPVERLPWERARHVLEASDGLMARLVNGKLLAQSGQFALADGVIDALNAELQGASGLLWERVERPPPSEAEWGMELDYPALASLLTQRGAVQPMVELTQEEWAVLEAPKSLCIDHFVLSGDGTYFFRPVLALVDHPPTDSMRRLLAARALISPHRARLDGALAQLAALEAASPEDVRPALEALGSLHAFRAAFEDPLTALSALLHAPSDAPSLAARLLSIAQARPNISLKALSDVDLEWDDLAAALGV